MVDRGAATEAPERIGPAHPFRVQSSPQPGHQLKGVLARRRKVTHPIQGFPAVAAKSVATALLRRNRVPKRARLSAGSSEPVLVSDGQATSRHAAATMANLHTASDCPARLGGRGINDARNPEPMMMTAAAVMRRVSGNRSLMRK